MTVQSNALSEAAARLVHILRAESDRVKTTNLLVLYGAGVVLCAQLVISHLIIRRGLKAVLDLKTATVAVGSGDFDTSVEATRPDEIGELARSFSEMASNLKTVTARKSDLEREINERRLAQTALEQSETRYRTLFSSIDEGFCIIEVLFEDGRPVDYRFLEANPAFEAQTGLKHAVGKRVRELVPAHEEHWFEIYGRIAATGQAERFTQQAQRLGRWYDVFAFKVGAAGERKVGVIFMDVTERKRVEDQLRRSNELLEQRVRERTAELNARAEQLARLSSQLTMTEQRERKHLAKVLHDGLQQYLVAAKLSVGGLLDQARDEAVREAARGVEVLLSDCIAVSRSLAAELSPPILHDAGILAAIEWLARWMSKKHGLHIELAAEMDSVALSEDVKVLLFESVRELLLNVVKHADVGAARVQLRLEDPQHLRVTVSDRGGGFDLDHVLRQGNDGSGFGLLSIRERLALIGGRLEITSAPGQGSRLSLIAPLQKDTTGAAAGLAETAPMVGVHPQPTVRPNGRIRILLTDDHAVMREGLARLLTQEPDFEVIGEANDGREAVAKAEALKPDVILMDISMPNLNGVDATRIIHRNHPDIRIIGLSFYNEDERAREMLDAGARCYMTKSGPAHELKNAIRASMDPISPPVL